MPAVPGILRRRRRPRPPDQHERFDTYAGNRGVAIGTLLETGYLRHLLDEAERGAEEVLVRKNFIFLPIVVASIGLIAMLLGDSATRYLQIDDRKLTFPDLVVLLAPLALPAHRRRPRRIALRAGDAFSRLSGVAPALFLVRVDAGG
jgi:hypothetical protein